MADAIKYNVSKGWYYYSTDSVFTRKEILDVYNDRRQGEGLPKIYTLKLMAICENININKTKKKVDFENERNKEVSV